MAIWVTAQTRDAPITTRSNWRSRSRRRPARKLAGIDVQFTILTMTLASLIDAPWWSNTAGTKPVKMMKAALTTPQAVPLKRTNCASRGEMRQRGAVRLDAVETLAG